MFVYIILVSGSKITVGGFNCAKTHVPQPGPYPYRCISPALLEKNEVVRGLWKFEGRDAFFFGQSVGR